MTELIYILGSGRSGSTVVERVLNSASDVVAVGEVHALWRLPLSDLVCSCGAPVQSCAFWGRALGHADIGGAELARLAQLERDVVRNRYLWRLGFDLDRIRSDPKLREFATLQRRLFEGVRVAGQGRTVLDSSKAGPRAWVLAAFLAPKILHVYRCAEDVIASWRRPKFEPSTNAPMKKPSLQGAAVDWVKAEQAARRLALVADVTRLDYGAFARTPRAVLGELGRDVDWVDDRTVRPGCAYHSVLGNPDRFDPGVIRIAPQKATDRARFGWYEQGAIRAIGKTLERAYP